MQIQQQKKTSKARIREVLCPIKNIPIYDNIYTQAALFLYIVHFPPRAFARISLPRQRNYKVPTRQRKKEQHRKFSTA
jgi:hypothetical protein